MIPGKEEIPWWLTRPTYSLRQMKEALARRAAEISARYNINLVAW